MANDGEGFRPKIPPVLFCGYYNPVCTRSTFNIRQCIASSKHDMDLLIVHVGGQHDSGVYRQGRIQIHAAALGRSKGANGQERGLDSASHSPHRSLVDLDHLKPHGSGSMATHDTVKAGDVTKRVGAEVVANAAAEFVLRPFANSSSLHPSVGNPSA